MKCAKCNSNMKRVAVKVHGATSKAISYQCPNCDYVEFEPESSKKVVEELRETPLKIKQKIVKLSQERLGIYFNSNVVRSLNLQKGEEIYLSVPDKKHIVLEIGEKNLKKAFGTLKLKKTTQKAMEEIDEGYD